MYPLNSPNVKIKYVMSHLIYNLDLLFQKFKKLWENEHYKKMTAYFKNCIQILKYFKIF